MASPRAWDLLRTLSAVLAKIRIESGYHSDIGERIWLEPAQRPEEDAIGLTIVSLGIARDEAQPMSKHRHLRVLLEAAYPTTLDDAHQRAHELAEDIEDVLEADSWMPEALPARFEEAAILDRPEGLPVIVVQVVVTMRYRR